MRTYSHGLIGYLIYRKATPTTQLWAAIGAMLPDLFLVLGFPFHVLPETAVGDSLHQLFHHSQLHTITLLLHSFVISLPLLIVAYFGNKKLLPFCVGLVSHGVVDLLTHQQWGYNHLYPLAGAEIVGPVSYTTFWFSIIEHAFVAVVAVQLYNKHWRRKRA